jgi:hypothetical protein
MALSTVDTGWLHGDVCSLWHALSDSNRDPLPDDAAGAVEVNQRDRHAAVKNHG